LALQVVGQVGHFVGALVKPALAEQVVEEPGAFVPPVAKQLGIVGRHDDRRALHQAMQMADLLLAVIHKVGGVLRGFFAGPVGVVELFVGEPQALAGNFVIFDAHVFALAVGHDVGLDVFVLGIPAQVTVKLAILGGTGVAHLG
jgi:hypothetical protein